MTTPAPDSPARPSGHQPDEDALGPEGEDQKRSAPTEPNREEMVRKTIIDCEREELYVGAGLWCPSIDNVTSTIGIGVYSKTDDDGTVDTILTMSNVEDAEALARQLLVCVELIRRREGTDTPPKGRRNGT